MTLLDNLNSIIAQREDNYDSPLPNFLRIALYWSIWKEQVVTPLDVIFMMDLIKTAREQHNHSDDTLLDKVGYTVSCYERIDGAMKDLGYAEGAEYFRRFKLKQYESHYIGVMYQILKDWKKHEKKQFKTSTKL